MITASARIWRAATSETLRGLPTLVTKGRPPGQMPVLMRIPRYSQVQDDRLALCFTCLGRPHRGTPVPHSMRPFGVSLPQ